MEMIFSPDAYKVVGDYLRAALVASGDTTTRVGTSLRVDDTRAVILAVVDSDVRQLVLQFCTIKFECWVNDGPLSQQAAQALGQNARGLLGAMQDTVQGGSRIYRVEDGEFGFSDAPDDKTGIERYVFHLNIAMRRTALNLPTVLT